MATLNEDRFFADAAHWDIHRPDYGTLMGTVGGATATNEPDTARSIVNTAARSPVVLAFTIQGAEDYVYIGHSPTTFPQDLADPCTYDNRVAVLVGNDLASASSVVLPATAWQCTGG